MWVYIKLTLYRLFRLNSEFLVSITTLTNLNKMYNYLPGTAYDLRHVVDQQRIQINSFV